MSFQSANVVSIAVDAVGSTGVDVVDVNAVDVVVDRVAVDDVDSVGSTGVNVVDINAVSVGIVGVAVIGLSVVDVLSTSTRNESAHACGVSKCRHCDERITGIERQTGTVHALHRPFVLYVLAADTTANVDREADASQNHK